MPDAPTLWNRAGQILPSVGRYPPRAAKCNTDGHCLFQPVWDDTRSTDLDWSKSDPLPAMLEKIGDAGRELGRQRRVKWSEVE